MIGTALKLKRRMIGLSQQQLADRLGVTFQQIQKYESGTNRISASRLNKAAEVFGVSIADFFTTIRNRTSSANLSEGDAAALEANRSPISQDEASALLTAIGKLDDPRARRCLLEMAELLAQAHEPER